MRDLVNITKAIMVMRQYQPVYLTSASAENWQHKPDNMIILLTALVFAAGIGYYFINFKPDQDEKISKKTKSKGTVAPPVEPDDSYAEIINDYPTYGRQNNVTNKLK